MANSLRSLLLSSPEQSKKNNSINGLQASVQDVNYKQIEVFLHACISLYTFTGVCTFENIALCLSLKSHALNQHRLNALIEFHFIPTERQLHVTFT